MYQEGGTLSAMRNKKLWQDIHSVSLEDIFSVEQGELGCWGHRFSVRWSRDGADQKSQERKVYFGVMERESYGS